MKAVQLAAKPVNYLYIIHMSYYTITTNNKRHNNHKQQQETHIPDPETSTRSATARNKSSQLPSIGTLWAILLVFAQIYQFLYSLPDRLSTSCASELTSYSM